MCLYFLLQSSHSKQCYSPETLIEIEGKLVSKGMKRVFFDAERSGIDNGIWEDVHSLLLWLDEPIDITLCEKNDSQLHKEAKNISFLRLSCGYDSHQELKKGIGKKVLISGMLWSLNDPEDQPYFMVDEFLTIVED